MLHKRQLHGTGQLLSTLIGQNALITGGSRGVGLAIGQKFASEGCNVLLIGRDHEKLAEECKKLPVIDEKQNHEYLKFDLKEYSDISSTFATKKSNLSVLNNANILVNCAGMSQASLLLRTSDSSIVDIINTNLTSSILLSKHVSKIMAKQALKHQPKSIINISTCLTLKPVIGTVAYVTSKGGLESFTKALAVELGLFGIKVNAIAPGLLLDTSMGRLANVSIYQPKLKDDSKLDLSTIADVALFLASLSMTGQVLTVDKGFTL